VDAEHQAAYWFPRNCPRVTLWATPSTTPADRERFFGLSSATRVHAIESAWLERMRSAELFAYRMPPEPFELDDSDGGFWVSRERVLPLRCDPVGDLLQRHAEAGIELRVVPSLRPLHRAVPQSSVGFSIIRMRNAGP